MLGFMLVISFIVKFKKQKVKLERNNAHNLVYLYIQFINF